MPVFEFEMIETRVYDVTYYVEADSEEEALEQAMIGNTDSEGDESCREVVNRDLWESHGEVEE